MEYIVNEIMMLVFTIISAIVTPFVIAAIASLRARMASSAFLNRIDAEGKMRKGVLEAIQTAILKGLANNQTGQQIIETAVSYVKESSPEYLEKLGMSNSVLRDKIKAALNDELDKRSRG